MTNVVQFKDLQAQQQEKQSIQEQKDHMNWLLSILTKDEVANMLIAMENGDNELFQQSTQPAIRREAIRTFNKGELKL